MTRLVDSVGNSGSEFPERVNGQVVRREPVTESPESPSDNPIRPPSVILVISNFEQAETVQNNDRICLFMDRIPELYIGFLGVLKMGGIAQPLFSAFAHESLFTRLNDAQTIEQRHETSPAIINNCVRHASHEIVSTTCAPS